MDDDQLRASGSSKRVCAAEIGAASPPVACAAARGAASPAGASPALLSGPISAAAVRVDLVVSTGAATHNGALIEGHGGLRYIFDRPERVGPLLAELADRSATVSTVGHPACCNPACISPAPAPGSTLSHGYALSVFAAPLPPVTLPSCPPVHHLLSPAWPARPPRNLPATLR